MIKTVYLAGPIQGLTKEEAWTWREYVTDSLISGVQALNPLRGCSELLPDSEVLGYEKDYHEDPMRTSRGIMTRDYFDCTQADMVFVNFLGAQAVSIGTVMEIAWCHATSTPLVIVMEDKGNPHDHAMIQEACGFRATSLDAGIKIVNDTLRPYVFGGEGCSIEDRY